ncbi:MAG TPA: AMP-dependent synthetase, partial [Porticoccaceae bacterium]|nr:AMP-dependent synthetase [Porticoccaceae bacterium]
VHLQGGTQFSEAALKAAMKGYVATYKIPEKIWFRQEPLLRVGSGKIDRVALRKACLKLTLE